MNNKAFGFENILIKKNQEECVWEFSQELKMACLSSKILLIKNKNRQPSNKIYKKYEQSTHRRGDAIYQ